MISNERLKTMNHKPEYFTNISKEMQEIRPSLYPHNYMMNQDSDSKSNVALYTFSEFV